MADSKELVQFIQDAAIVDERMERILKRKLVPQDTYTPPKYLLNFCGCKCLPLGEISAISGKAKSGKTALLSLFAEAFFSEYPNEQLMPTENRVSKILYFDTEQSENSVNGVSLKVRTKTKKANIDDYMHMFCLRNDSTEERTQFIEDVLSLTKESSELGYSSNENYIVFIDGIRDLMLDINSPTETSNIINRLLRWTAEYPNCAFIIVLHENPRSSDDKMMRGAIGTEIEHKMFTNFHISRNKNNRAIREVSIGVSRGEETENKIMFAFGDNGVPNLCADGDEFFSEADQITVSEKERLERKPSAAENHVTKLIESNHWQYGDIFTRSEFIAFFETLTGKKERQAREVLTNYEGIYWFGSGNTKSKVYKYCYKQDPDDEDDS